MLASDTAPPLKAVDGPSDAPDPQLLAEIRRLKSVNQDQAAELSRMKAALTTYEAADHDDRGVKESKIAMKARLSALQALSDEQAGTIQALRGIRNDYLRMDVLPEEETRRRSVEVQVLKQFFEGAEEEIPFILRRESDEFTYGYALTVHKAQGSQWDNLVLFDESYAFREHRSRWLYTGLTRAAERITVVV